VSASLSFVVQNIDIGAFKMLTSKVPMGQNGFWANFYGLNICRDFLYFFVKIEKHIRFPKI